ncbi:MAG TPA: penicillin-binding protein 2 [Candidatus Bathyarchaeia archaeon]|nr:penicillin-binding protein 2 [Candidatus Bathyarchaeia archaeon]
MRLNIIRIIVVFLFIVLAVDLVYVQVLRGNYFYNLSVNNRIRVIPLEGQRGRILDRNGVVLADSRLSFNVTVIPQDIRDKEVLFGYLSEILDVEQEKLVQRFEQRRYTPFAPVVVAEDVEKKTAMVLEENKFRFPGLYIQETFRRWYPFNEVASHVLGYVGLIDTEKIKRLKNYGYSRQSVVGYSGVEEYYDKYLMGKEGGLQIEVNSRGQQVQLLGIREPERGTDVQVTLDAGMQEVAFEIFKTHPGALVIIDLATADVLALVSSPGYDPNVFSDPKRSREKAKLFTNDGLPMFNRVLKGQYPPGSVFKTVVSVAGLSENVITRYTTYHCPGYFQLGKRRARCTHVHGSVQIVKALGESCNVFYFNMGLVVGPERIQRYAKMFGLGTLTHVDLPAEEQGFVPTKNSRRGKNTSGWYKGDTLNLSIGQGDLLATPIQMARLMATVALDGRVMEPHVLKAVDGREPVTTSIVRSLHIKKEVMNIVQEGLRDTVLSQHGTARILNMDGFEFYGKTGTAQTVPGKDSHAWFAGYNLVGKKKVAFCVFLEHGGSSYYAVQLTKELFKALREKNII